MMIWVRMATGALAVRGVEKKMSVQLMRMQTDLKLRVDFFGGS